MLAKLNIDNARGNDRYQKTSSPNDRRAAPPSMRSESRSATPSRGYSRRDMQMRGRQDEDAEDAYPDELYDMYQGGGPGSSRTSRQTSRRVPQRYMEDEEDGSDYGSFDEGDFEMVSNRRPGTNSMSSRGGSRRPEIRKIRVKVHAEDVRYIMVGAAVEFPDFIDRIREKFGLRRRFKIKIRDEDMPNGDMITMGDQDDLDMAIMTAKSQARKARQDIGKMEVSHNQNAFLHHSTTLLIRINRSGFRKFRRTIPPTKPHDDIMNKFARPSLYNHFLLLLVTPFYIIIFSCIFRRWNSVVDTGVQNGNETTLRGKRRHEAELDCK